MGCAPSSSSRAPAPNGAPATTAPRAAPSASGVGTAPPGSLQQPALALAPETAGSMGLAQRLRLLGAGLECNFPRLSRCLNAHVPRILGLTFGGKMKNGAGRSASLELSPAQAMSPKLKYTLIGALDEAVSAKTALEKPLFRLHLHF